MKAPVRVLVMAAVLMGLTCCVNAQDQQLLLTIEPTKQQPRNSEGDIIRLKDGKLLLVYSRFTGGNSDHAKGDLAMRTSTDDGQTWSDDKILITGEGGMNVMSVTLLRLQDGRIAFFYGRKNSLTDCRTLLRISDDEAQSWSDPVEMITDQVGYYVLNNDRVIQLSNGRLVAPVALHNQPGWKKMDMQGTIMCYLSDDLGKTWRRSKDTFIGLSPAGNRITLQEPGVIELLDGRMMMYCRTKSQGCQYICYSSDGGETWTKPVPSSLKSPRSPASIKRIPWNNKLLCVWNDHSGLHPFPSHKQRSPLCAAVSSDDGATWSDSRVIEPDPDGWFCYTSITFLKDCVLLTYCGGDSKVGGLNRLKMTSLSKKWLDEIGLDK